MINCTVKVYRDTDVLDHGHKASESSAPLWEGPAYLSSPSRGWQQEAAFEGVLTGELHVHTHVSLQNATSVSISTHALVGDYQVLATAVSGKGWRLALGRRPHSAS